jgi:hypothetical protein
VTGYVVILAGGDQPGSAPPPLTEVARAVIAEQAGIGWPQDRDAAARVMGHTWTAAMNAAREHYRPRAVYVVGDETEAARLAGMLSEEVDPAWYLAAADPLHEAISAWQVARATATGYAQAAALQPGYVVTAPIAEDGGEDR